MRRSEGLCKSRHADGGAAKGGRDRLEPYWPSPCLATRFIRQGLSSWTLSAAGCECCPRIRQVVRHCCASVCEDGWLHMVLLCIHHTTEQGVPWALFPVSVVLSGWQLGLCGCRPQPHPAWMPFWGYGGLSSGPLPSTKSLAILPFYFETGAFKLPGGTWTCDPLILAPKVVGL